MEEEKKDVIEPEVVDSDEKGEETKEESNPDNDHSRAIHGFGKAADMMFVPGIVSCIATFSASVTCNIIQGVIVAITGDANNAGAKVFSILASTGWSIFGSLLLPMLIGGIVFHCLTRSFKAKDPKWKDKVDDDKVF